MERNLFIELDKFWKDIPNEEKENAAEKNLFIICRESSPKYPLMNIAVYEPLLNCPENLIAIFRNKEDSKRFVNSLTNHRTND